MLKSTHRPQSGPAALPSLPPGWTEHTAPTGHAYYYNADTKQSTYTRPTEPATNVSSRSPNDGVLFQSVDPSQYFNQQPPFADSSQDFQVPGRHHDFNTFTPPGSERHLNASAHNYDRGRGNHRGRGFRDRRGRNVPEDRPRSKHVLPDQSLWLLIKTKLGRRFFFNPETRESFWKIPELLQASVQTFDQNERDGKNVDTEIEEDQDAEQESETKERPVESGNEVPPVAPSNEQKDEDEDSDEYEEVEVTDDEDENPSKRLRTEEPGADQPHEFNEDDIAFQLAAMGQDYGDDAAEEGWDEDAEEPELSDEGSIALFKDMLDDYVISPFSTWEKVIEDAQIVVDERYTVLPNMKSRKDVWGQWSRDRIQLLKEQRGKEEKKDPRIGYLAFLHEHATPKLYWPEFRRKFKKEAEMRDAKLSDKDREKLYRDHISRLKLPPATLKSDLSTLLKSLPLATLDNTTPLSFLPAPLLADIRYISLPPSTRDPLIEAYISTLPVAPTEPSGDSGLPADSEAERARRDEAIAHREVRVAVEKRRQRLGLDVGKAKLKEKGKEVERAMRVGKEGLRQYLDEEVFNERGRSGGDAEEGL
ncbi:MAG: hypothetical protein M1833_003101 [Piccolia ochrophora]|nr:MAG: hypothetical protein M1833_003101 [Piccolia ochrophora]